MPLCSLEQFLAEQLSGSTFKVLLDVMFLYSRNALKVAFLDGGSWFFFTSHKSASLGKKPKINKDYSIYRFLFPAIAKHEQFRKKLVKIALKIICIGKFATEFLSINSECSSFKTEKNRQIILTKFSL